MRLIDGDNLKDELLGIIFERGQESSKYENMIEIGAMRYSDVEYENGIDDGLEICYSKIDSEPSIKAISLNWINNYKNTSGPITKYILNRMIKDWDSIHG